MKPRRNQRLTPAIAPITPDQRPPIGELSRAELVAQNLDLKRLLSVERRRNARIEQILVKHLEETEARNGALREVVFSNLSTSMLERGRS